MKPIDLNSLIGVLSIFSPLTQSSPGGVGDAFSANKSTRPYTTFELDQIRQHAKRYVIDIILCLNVDWELKICFKRFSQTF